MEQQCGFYTKWITAIGSATIAVFMFGIFTVAFSIFQIWRGNLDASTWFFPFKVSVPFDTTTILGWYVYATISSMEGCSAAVFLLVTVFYLACCCMYLKACCEHIQIIFDDADEAIQAKNKSERQQKKQLQENIITAHFLHMKIME